MRRRIIAASLLGLATLMLGAQQLAFAQEEVDVLDNSVKSEAQTPASAPTSVPVTPPEPVLAPSAQPVRLLTPPLPPPPTIQAAKEPENWGLSAELEIATSYIFRGANLFANSVEGKNSDPNMRLSPVLTWAVPDTGLSLGYWGAFQLNGDNVGDNIDAAVGAEQDLWINYVHSINEQWDLAFGLASYIYPFADKETAHARVPLQLDPGLAVIFHNLVDVALKANYMHLVQEPVNHGAYRYIYLNPEVAKQVEIIKDELSISATLGFGYKIFNDNLVENNKYDVLCTIVAPYHLKDGFYLRPGIGLAWTNIAESDFGEEVAYWGQLAFGAEF